MNTTLAIHPIGYVRSPVAKQTDEGWGRISSRVEVLPVYRPGLVGLDQFSHVMVVTFMHEAAYDPQRHRVRRPRGLDTMPEVGIFAQRAKDRPNPIGITSVQLVDLTEDAVVVQGLDAIDGTPVLDLKPYYPEYDRIIDASVPEWVAGGVRAAGLLSLSLALSTKLTTRLRPKRLRRGTARLSTKLSGAEVIC